MTFSKTLIVLVLSLSFYGSSQNLTLSLNTSSEILVEPEVQLENLDIGKTKLEFRLANGVSGPFEFGVSMRETQSFGPIGTFIFRNAMNIKTSGAFDFSFQAEGVFAALAANLNLSLFTVNPGSFSFIRTYEPQRPFLLPQDAVALGFGADLHASYRIRRNLIMSISPKLYAVEEQGIGGKLASELRFARLIGNDDLKLKLDSYLSPDHQVGYVSLGVQYHIKRRGFPDIRATLLAGGNVQGIAPGFRFSLEHILATNGYGFDLKVEPYLVGYVPYYLSAFYKHNWSNSNLEATLYTSLANELSVPPAYVKLSYSFLF